MKKNNKEIKKVEAKIIQSEVFEELDSADIENNLIQKKIDEKILLKELAEKEIRRYKKGNIHILIMKIFLKDIEVDNTKYFFDEGIVDKLSQKN